MAKRGEWKTPTHQLKYREQMYKKLEQKTSPSPYTEEVRGIDEEISYFGNKRHYGRVLSDYEQFFSFAAVLPLYDQYKARDDRADFAVIRERIWLQNVTKTVPALTSLQYGRPARLRDMYDEPEKKFRYIDQRAPYYRRAGARGTIEDNPEELP